MKKTKKVLHLLPSSSFSGAENVACTIINNVKTDCYYCSPNGTIVKNLSDRKVKYIPLKKFNIRNVKKIVKKYNIDIVHAHDYKASFVASFLPKKIKIISQLHCNYDFGKKWNIYTFLYYLVQKRFSKIIVVSKDILDDVVFSKKICNKTVVIDNVVDSNFVIKMSKEYSTLSYDLVFLARLVPVKRPLFFIDIVKKIKENNKKIKACIIGRGELYDECKKKIEDEDLVDNIDLLGFKDNPFPFIRNSKISVLPSLFEGLPMSVIESMILGTLVIVNKGVGGLEMMYNNYSEYICEEIDEYVKCINKLLNMDKNDYKYICDDLIKPFIDTKKYGDKFDYIYDNI